MCILTVYSEKNGVYFEEFFGGNHVIFFSFLMVFACILLINSSFFGVYSSFFLFLFGIFFDQNTSLLLSI